MMLPNQRMERTASGLRRAKSIALLIIVAMAIFIWAVLVWRVPKCSTDQVLRDNQCVYEVVPEGG